MDVHHKYIKWLFLAVSEQKSFEQSRNSMEMLTLANKECRSE